MSSNKSDLETFLSRISDGRTTYFVDTALAQIVRRYIEAQGPFNDLDLLGLFRRSIVVKSAVPVVNFSAGEIYKSSPSIAP
ncbi:MAG: hypothetical protein LW875_03690 [Proteobacteria bacterium]|jgi:hypothetical protein|nr:hypothetical protein [Pseudomonadota bacterium]